MKGRDGEIKRGGDRKDEDKSWINRKNSQMFTKMKTVCFSFFLGGGGLLTSCTSIYDLFQKSFIYNHFQQMKKGMFMHGHP